MDSLSKISKETIIKLNFDSKVIKDIITEIIEYVSNEFPEEKSDIINWKTDLIFIDIFLTKKVKEKNDEGF